MNSITRHCAAAATLVLGAAGPAFAAESEFSVGAGIDYTTGKFGGATSTDVTYLPFFAKFDTGPLGLKLTIPYLEITGPGNVVGTDRVVVTPGAAATRRTASGLGDVVAAGSYRMYDNRQSRVGVDLTGKYKFATADDAKGLGTGENDYSLQGDLYKTYANSLSALGTLGYKVFGSPAGVTLDNVWFGTVGGAYKFSDAATGGLLYDYRQAVTATGSPISEVTGYVSFRLTPATRVQAYLLRGLSSGSPDWGGGVQLTFGF